MPKTIRLKELIPDFYSDVLEMNTLLNVEQFEIDDLTKIFENQQKNQFVMTADKRGIEVWESLVGITRNPYYDLETRRYDVLARLLPPKPLTIKYIRELIKTLNINAKLDVDVNNFHVNASMETTDPNAARRLQSLLRGLLPSNLTFTALNISTDSPYQENHAGIGSINAVSYTNKDKGDK
ncbi:putative phage tail protein [Fructilactobacillus vespulae]|uniref:putative phage tail protein n=1 Tax=Fructilactobacillus vespulae TaxID=1249630 RepID=UPI0039B5E8B1